MTVTIRDAVPDDATAVGALAKEFQTYLPSLNDDTDFQWGADEYLRYGFGNDRLFDCLIAEDDGVAVGFTLFHSGYDTDQGKRGIYMVDLFVTASFRGRGVGQQLLNELATRARLLDAHWIAWSVLKQNVSAVQFYEHLGAKYLDKLHHMYLPLETN